MEINFSKYHGAGNDFIMIDNRKMIFNSDDFNLIANLCHRRFGIGADGLILLQNHEDYDFQMRYFNADGHESTMCGNGGRCAVAFAKELGMLNSSSTSFFTIDGLHSAEILNNDIKLKMADVHEIRELKDYYYTNTGSPHIVLFNNDIEIIDVVNEGRKYRYDKRISDNGVNVNFIQVVNENLIKIRTYERGVEDETWSCGTGAVAAAIAYVIHENVEGNNLKINVLAKGGKLTVLLQHAQLKFHNVFLIGNAKKVFNGIIKA